MSEIDKIISPEPPSEDDWKWAERIIKEHEAEQAKQIKCRECGIILTEAEIEEFNNRCLGCMHYNAWANA